MRVNKYPEKLDPFYTDYESRYLIAYGGRASGKSWGAVRAAFQRNLAHGANIVVFRDFANTLENSVFSIFRNVIKEFDVEHLYKINRSEIFNIKPGKESIISFQGYDRNTVSVKGLEGYDIAIIEEAETLTERAFDIIDNTIRKDGSQILLIFNPHLEKDYVYQNFIIKPMPDSRVIHINYTDNPWCPNVTKRLAHNMKERDYNKFKNIYLGEPLVVTEAMIFAKQVSVERFETPDIDSVDDQRFYFGVDWGFSVDALAGIKAFIQNNCLYICDEVYEHKVINDKLYSTIAQIPGIEEGVVYADSARPEHIDSCRRGGMSMVSVNKAKMYDPRMKNKSDKKKQKERDAEPKISFMRAFIDFVQNLDKIIIHPRCENARVEFSSFAYKFDAKTNEIFPVVADNQADHLVDALRYGLAPKIRGGTGIEDFNRAFRNQNMNR